MADRISLGDIWNGRETDSELTRESRRSIDLIVGKTATDSDMECGGRLALDRHLRKIEVISLNCGECAIKRSCSIGYNRKE